MQSYHRFERRVHLGEEGGVGRQQATQTMPQPIRAETRTALRANTAIKALRWHEPPGVYQEEGAQSSAWGHRKYRVDPLWSYVKFVNVERFGYW